MPSSMPSNEEEKTMYYFIIRREMQRVRYHRLMCNEFGSKVLWGGWGSCVINGNEVGESVRGVGELCDNPLESYSALLVTCAANKTYPLHAVCEFCVWRNGGMREVGGIKQG